MQGELLYILAPSFSGSTLLTYLLAQHPDIATVGELKATQMGAVEKYRCSCGAPILECGFWREVQTKSAAAGFDFSPENFGTVFEGDGPVSNKIIGAGVRGGLFERVRSLVLGLMPGVSSRLDDIARRNRTLADIICQVQGGRIFLDGSKDPTRLLYLAGSGLWNVKVICLQRDGRGVSSSIRSHENLDYTEAIRWWKHAVHKLQSMKNRLGPEQTFDLKYEDLCTDPAGCMARIWSWLNLEPLDIDAGDFRKGDFHILGNAMRLKGASEIRLDEKWKRLLGPEDLQLFENRAGDVNRELGY